MSKQELHVWLDIVGMTLNYIAIPFVLTVLVPMLLCTATWLITYYEMFGLDIFLFQLYTEVVRLKHRLIRRR